MKRILDLFCSVISLVILGPFLVLVAILIKLDSPGPVFYRPARAGFLGKPFHMFKFRTMVQDADRIGGASTPNDDRRITKVGRFLRKFKIDELPQLFNVLAGQMSLVGPRPQVLWAVERYTDEEKIALTVLPGITDYASLRFRNEGEILRGSADPDKDYFEKIHPEKMRLTLEYVRNQSFWFDCKILLETLAVLVFRIDRGAPSSKISNPNTPEIPIR